jgi:hypothetical protein
MICFYVLAVFKAGKSLQFLYIDNLSYFAVKASKIKNFTINALKFLFQIASLSQKHRGRFWFQLGLDFF